MTLKGFERRVPWTVESGQASTRYGAHTHSCMHYKTFKLGCTGSDDVRSRKCLTARHLSDMTLQYNTCSVTDLYAKLHLKNTNIIRITLSLSLRDRICVFYH